MKKVCMFLFIGVFLALMVSLPGAAEEWTVSREKVKFTLSMGGLVASISQGYDFSFDFDSRGDTAEWTESVGNVGGAFGFDIAVGCYVTPEFEFYASYSAYSGDGMGGYTLTVPSAFYGEPPVDHTIANIENGFRASVVSFGIAIHPRIIGRIKPYFGAGFSSVTVKVDLLDRVLVTDHVEVDEYWFYPPYSHSRNIAESIEITKVGFTEESETVWGYNVKAGVNIKAGRNISIFAEGRYLIATAKFNRPEIKFKVKTIIDWYHFSEWNGDVWEDEGTYDSTAEEEFDIDDTVKINVGGIQGVIGLRFSF